MTTLLRERNFQDWNDSGNILTNIFNSSLQDGDYYYNTTGNGTQNGEKPKSVAVLASIIMAVIMIATIIGNACVCWIIHTNQELRTLPNLFVLNLAWCDLLTALVNGPFTITVLVAGDWIMGDTLCQFNGFTTTVFGIASVVTLAVISVNRCCMIVYTAKSSRWFTKKTSHRMIFGVWFFSALCAFPPMIGWSKYSFIPGKAICTLIWATDVSYTLVVLSAGVFLPFIIMSFSYTKIFLKVRENNRRITLQLGKLGNLSKFSNEHNVSSSEELRATAQSNGQSKPPLLDSPSTSSSRASHKRSNSCKLATPVITITASLGEGETTTKWLSGTLPLNSQELKAPSLANRRFSNSERIHRKGVHFLTTGDGQSLSKSMESLKSISPLSSPSMRRRSQRIKSDELKITFTLLIVIFVFLVSWAPISLVNFAETFFFYKIPWALDMMTVYMVFLQCAVNPLIYGLMNRNFRKGFTDIFCCRCLTRKR